MTATSMSKRKWTSVWTPH